ncbi:MAG: DeoR/GlpR family DNA-binding transcription regulator [Ruthenibacterium sp.]
MRNISPSLEFEAVCYTRNILMQVGSLPHAALAMAGGFYHPGTQMFTSDEGVAFIHNIRANKVFISAAGVHEELGISCANSYEVATKRAILKSARQHILVADSSKFGVVRSAYFCNLTDIDTVVTDIGLSPEWANLLRQLGIVLYQV